MTKRDTDESFDEEIRSRLARLEAGRRDGKWWRRATVLLLGVLASVPFAVDALDPMPHTFESGDLISASEMNENFDYLRNAITDVEGGVPSGAVMFFDLPSCPLGWSELVEARGRAVVGLDSGGTLRGTVGEGLMDLEDRAHGHVVDVPSFDSASREVDHTHTVLATTTLGGGEHNHQWLNSGYETWRSNGTTTRLFDNLDIASSPPAPTEDIPDLADGYTEAEPDHTHEIAEGTTGGASSSTSHAHTVDPPPQSSGIASTSDVMPYVQLLVCRRD
jgi:hypothetical protein